MALSKTWVTPAEIAEGVSDLPHMNAQLGNLILCIESVLLAGDDGTSSKYHRHGASTLANRPAAGQSGRIWKVTDLGDGIDMRDDGTKWVPLGVQVLERDLVQAGPANDAGETTLYSHEISAGILGATGGLKLTLGGVYLNNSGALDLLTLRVKYGGTTMLTSKSIDIDNNAEERQWQLQVLMLNSAADAQKCSAIFALSDAGSENFRAQHPASTFGRSAGVGYGTAAEDSSGALTLAVTADLEAAAATIYMKMELALLEIIPAA